MIVSKRGIDIPLFSDSRLNDRGQVPSAGFGMADLEGMVGGCERYDA